MTRGFRIVLCADGTLMSDYRLLLDGMIAAGQTAITPSFMMKMLLTPGIEHANGSARIAPLGLRRIEAALAGAGWDMDDVAVTGMNGLEEAVGTRTRLVGISSGDPLGIGMMSTTMTSLSGREPYTKLWFRRISETVARLTARTADARVVLGGPGSWQLERDEEARRRLGIDHVVSGYCEGNVADLFSQIIAGGNLPAAISGQGVSSDRIPRIKGPTVMGSVEISRGCGIGCGFCAMAGIPMSHLSLDTILSDVETNVGAGGRNVALVTEDVFRYAGSGSRPDPDALIGLLRRIREIPEVLLIQADHANVASAVQYSDEGLQEVCRLLSGGRRMCVWVNLGVETVSASLLKKHVGAAKLGPYAPEDWGEVCFDAVRRLTGAGFVPLVSLLMGLPGETRDDIEDTIRWVKKIEKLPAAVFPIFHAPIDGTRGALSVSDMSDAHWRLMRLAYRMNFKWMPRLFWNSQSTGGESLSRRVIMQVLGQAQSNMWRGIFAWRAKRVFI